MDKLTRKLIKDRLEVLNENLKNHQQYLISYIKNVEVTKGYIQTLEEDIAALKKDLIND